MEGKTCRIVIVVQRSIFFTEKFHRKKKIAHEEDIFPQSRFFFCTQLGIFFKHKQIKLCYLQEETFQQNRSEQEIKAKYSLWSTRPNMIDVPETFLTSTHIVFFLLQWPPAILAFIPFCNCAHVASFSSLILVLSPKKLCSPIFLLTVQSLHFGLNPKVTSDVDSP